MIVDKKLGVSGRRKADIVVDLRKFDFKPIPKIAKAKSTDQEDDEDEEQEEAGADSDFDYLLGMAIWSLTKEKIDKLLQQAGDKEAELLLLLEKTPNDLWNKDLDDFLVEWEVRRDPGLWTCLLRKGFIERLQGLGVEEIRRWRQGKKEEANKVKDEEVDWWG